MNIKVGTDVFSASEIVVGTIKYIEGQRLRFTISDGDSFDVRGTKADELYYKILMYLESVRDKTYHGKVTSSNPYHSMD